ncbi:hypothetical protein ACWCPM_26705 [Streptomyces sp. NPDC002309]
MNVLSVQLTDEQVVRYKSFGERFGFGGRHVEDVVEHLIPRDGTTDPESCDK